MSSYRLRPTADIPWWFALFGATTAMLLLPVLLLPVVPERNTTSPVMLGDAAFGWQVPLHRECRPAGGLMANGWNCGDVLVQTLVVPGSTDPDRTLRRMVRGLTMGSLPTADILREGDARMLIDEPGRSVGFTLTGLDDHPDQTLVAVLTGPGPETAPLADDTWLALTGRHLPEIVTEAIMQQDSGTGTWFHQWEKEMVSA